MRTVKDRVLQEYFESLAQGNGNPSQRARELLSSYAELNFHRNGGGHCQLCRAHVRHVLPVTLTRNDGTEARFSCLCQRCLLGEHALATTVEIAVGRARWVLKKPASPADETRRRKHG